MTASIDLSYSQIRNIVMQMPIAERRRLSEELNEQAVSESIHPYTMEELNARIDEAEDDIANGRFFAAEDMHGYFEQKYPWLCK